MKRKTIDVGGKKIEIDAYETDFGTLEEGTIKDFERALAKEEGHEHRIGEIADRIAAIVSRAVTQDRAGRYWEAADAIVKYEEEIESGGDERAPYQRLIRMLERVNEKVHENLKDNPDISRDSYSVAYLLKMRRLRKMMTREQVQRQIPYPFFHELLYDDLTAEERNAFLDRYERGEITTEQLRNEVKTLIASKKREETNDGQAFDSVREA